MHSKERIMNSSLLVQWKAIAVLVGVVALATPTTPYPSGAPYQACETLQPSHGSPSPSPSPYSISLGGGVTKYTQGRAITVTVIGTEFQGLLMQVRLADGSSGSRLGSWTSVATDTKLVRCSVDYNDEVTSVTHSNANLKYNSTFTWMPPSNLTADVQVVATVAESKYSWWTGIRSPVLTYDAETTTPPNTTSTTTLTTVQPTTVFHVSTLRPTFTTPSTTPQPPHETTMSKHDVGTTSHRPAADMTSTVGDVSGGDRISAFTVTILVLGAIVARLTL